MRYVPIEKAIANKLISYARNGYFFKYFEHILKYIANMPEYNEYLELGYIIPKIRDTVKIKNNNFDVRKYNLSKR